MSSALAIAAVTYVIKDLLDNSTIGDALPVPVTVSMLPPDRIEALPDGDGSKTRLNLFLYQVSPNQGWRNVDLPSRNGNGARVGNPPLALDLHYLLTAYGDVDLHAEILLGYAMQLLHERPVLDRAAIRQSLALSSSITGGGLPDSLRALATSGLADQVEQIRIVPEYLGIEEMSKLWTAVQGHYRPSIGYHVSVVLIESTVPVRSAIPVLTRGVDDRGAAVNVGIDSPFPALTSIVTPLAGNSANPGDLVRLFGRHLDATGIVVHLRNRIHDVAEQIPLPDSTNAQELSFTIPGGSALRVGVYAVEVALTSDGVERTTNELPLMIAPTLAIDSQSTTGTTTTFQISTTPEVLPAQRALLIVGDRQVEANDHPATTSTLEFEIDGLETGVEYPVRLRIDGIESTLIDRTTTPPRFTQTVTLT